MPLLAALAKAAKRRHVAFYAPGHKGGQGIAAPMQNLLGASVFPADLPELPELDNLFAPTGPIRDAQNLAAKAFGAEETFFLANGSTCGIEAAVLATCSPSDSMLMPRNAHQSVFAALTLSGAKPIYLTPVSHQSWDLALGCTAEQIGQALAKHPQVQTVLIVSPNYQGVCADVAAIAQQVHAHNATLIVDEAHGAHLTFHEQLPQGAIAAGADIVIQSTHKTLSALTQASMLHVQGQRIDRNRLRQALQLVQSTSPNYLLLASLDAARQQMVAAGQSLMAQTLQLVQQVRSQLLSLAPLTILSLAHLPSTASSFQLDLTRLVVDVSSLGITGFEADEWLHEQRGVIAELPTLKQLAFIFSLGNLQSDGDRLVQALTDLCSQWANPLKKQLHHSFETSATLPLTNTPPMTPREAFFAQSQVVEVAEAIGYIAAAPLCPYPPGIPVLLPGELVTSEAIAMLQQIQNSGGTITGSPDGGFQTMRIVQ